MAFLGRIMDLLENRIKLFITLGKILEAWKNPIIEWSFGVKWLCDSSFKVFLSMKDEF